MATFIDIENEILELKPILLKISNINTEDLVRSSILGSELNFADGVPYFERVLNIFREINNCNLYIVPFEHLQFIKSRGNQVLNTIDKIMSFSTTLPNALGERDAMISFFANSYEEYFSKLSPIISYSKRIDIDTNAFEKKINEKLLEIDNYSEQIKATANEASASLESIRMAAGEAGVKQHATIFKDQADSHSNISIIWLIATSVVGICGIVWGFLSFTFHPVKLSDPPKAFELIESFASKIIILTALYYLLVWCARNYSAHQHNFVVNKHRQNALSTFETFVKAAGDDVDVKNAVLLQVTQTIFSNQPSGYITKEGDSDSPNKIIEIMRSVGTASKVT